MWSTLRYPAALAFGSGLLQMAMGAQQIQIPMEDCDLPWADEWTSGRSTATIEWCASQIKNLQTITGIKVWNSKNKSPTYMEGMQVWFSNGDYTIVGNTPDDVFTRELHLDSGEDFKKIELLPMNLYWDQNLYGVRFTSSNDKQIYGGSEGDGIHPEDINWEGHAQTPIKGTLVGMKGKTGGHGIESISFYYVNAGTPGIFIQDLELHPNPEELNARPDKEKGVEVQSIQEGYSVNHLPNDKTTFHLSDTYHVKEIQTWTHAWTNEFHIGEEFGTEVTYDAALIKEVGSNKWNWEYKHTDTKGDLKGFEKWTDIAFTQDVPVANKSAVHVWAYTMKGEWDFEWKAKLTLSFEDNKKFTIPIEGKLKRVSYSGAWYHVEPAPYEEAVNGIQNGMAAIGEDGNVIEGDSLKDFMANIKGETPNPPSRVMRGV